MFVFLFFLFLLSAYEWNTLMNWFKKWKIHKSWKQRIIKIPEEKVRELVLLKWFSDCDILFQEHSFLSPQRISCFHDIQSEISYLTTSLQLGSRSKNLNSSEISNSDIFQKNQMLKRKKTKKKHCSFERLLRKIQI